MRKFGIELEMVSPSGSGEPLAAARAVLHTAGITGARTNTHFGRSYEVWQCKGDASIQPSNRGVEVVSRILPPNAESYNEVTRAVTALDAAGFGINRSCGFHVHISCADVPMHIRRLIVLRYAQLQDEINAFLPPSRRSNSYARALSSGQRVDLGNAIDSGGRWVSSPERYCVTNVAWIDSGDQARIEFRQAAGTCNAVKVVGWVRFLQDMIDEVVRRATAPGVRFGHVSAPVAPRPIVAPARPLAQVPRMRAGSDAHRALTQLCATGVITSGWAENQGIGDNVLRRIIVGFRRHGADLDTQRMPTGGPNYVLRGVRSLPLTPEQVFATQAAAAPVPAPVPVPAPAAPVVTRAASFINYPIWEGMAAETSAWVRARMEDFEAASSAERAA